MKNANNEKEDDEIKKYKIFSLSSNQITVVTNSGCKIATVELDKNFFENLLIYEMELEDEFSMEKLFELIKQYSIAIEYYLQTDPKRAKAYQNRMEYLLTNKDTLIQLKRQNDRKNNINNNNNNEKNKQNNKLKSQLNSKKEEIKIRQDDINIQAISEKVNKFLISSNQKEENKISGKNIINEDLEKQSLNWKEKLKAKKRNNNRFSNKTSVGGFRKKFQTSIKNDLSLSPLSSTEVIKNESDKDDKSEKVSEFKSVYEELYDSNQNYKIEEIDKNEDNVNKIEEIKEENKEEDDNNNVINIENKENEIIEKDKDKENEIKENNNDEIKEEITNSEVKNEENKEKNENEIKEELKEEKEENIIKKEKPEEDSKKSEQEENKDKNEIKEDNLKENQIQDGINKISLDQGINSPKVEKKSPEEAPQSPFQELLQVHRRMSILDEDLLNKVNTDEEISTSIKSQITSLENIIHNLNKKNNSQNEIDNEEEEESEVSNSNLIQVKPKANNNSTNNLDKIPAKFQGAYMDVETIIGEYMNDFNHFFYKEIFEQFSSGLKELYEQKYKKYIEIRNEYHNQIKENEYLLEIDDNLTKEKKEEIQQTIESLNEEQQHQIDVVEDEFNKKISDKISEFKLKAFKHNSGIQLLEEKVKLDIYSLINEAFY